MCKDCGCHSNMKVKITAFVKKVINSKQIDKDESIKAVENAVTK